MFLIILAWSLLLSAVLLAIGALIVARRGSVVHLLKQFSLLSERQREIEQEISLLQVAIKNLKAQISMRELREKRRAAQHELAPGDSNDEDLSDDSTQLSPDASEEDKAAARRRMNELVTHMTRRK